MASHSASRRLAGSKKVKTAGASLWLPRRLQLGECALENWLNPNIAVCRSNPSTIQAVKSWVDTMHESGSWGHPAIPGLRLSREML